MTLYQKLVVSLLVVFILIIGTFFCVSRSLEAISRDKAEQELHKDLAAHLVHDNPLLSDGAHDKAALENLFHSMMILGANFEFYVLDTQGNVLTYSAKPGEVIREKIDLAPVKALVTDSMSIRFMQKILVPIKKKYSPRHRLLKMEKLEAIYSS